VEEFDHGLSNEEAKYRAQERIEREAHGHGLFLLRVAPTEAVIRPTVASDPLFGSDGPQNGPTGDNCDPR
jgi:hypothetical protein